MQELITSSTGIFNGNQFLSSPSRFPARVPAHCCARRNRKRFLDRLLFSSLFFFDSKFEYAEIGVSKFGVTERVDSLQRFFSIFL